MDRDLKTGIIVAACVLGVLFLFKGSFFPTQETHEITEYDVTNYIHNLHNQYEKLNNEAVKLQGELMRLKTTDLVKENERLRGRIHPAPFSIILTFLVIFFFLFFIFLLENYEKKRSIKQLKGDMEEIEKIANKDDKLYKKRLNEIKDMSEGW